MSTIDRSVREVHRGVRTIAGDRSPIDGNIRQLTDVVRTVDADVRSIGHSGLHAGTVRCAAQQHRLRSGCRERLGGVCIDKTHDVKCAAGVRVASADAVSCEAGSVLRSIDSEQRQIDGDTRAGDGANRAIAGRVWTIDANIWGLHGDARATHADARAMYANARATRATFVGQAPMFRRRAATSALCTAMSHDRLPHLYGASNFCRASADVLRAVANFATLAATWRRRAPRLVTSAPTLRRRAPSCRRRAPRFATHAPTLPRDTPTFGIEAPTFRRRTSTLARQAPSRRRRAPIFGDVFQCSHHVGIRISRNGSSQDAGNLLLDGTGRLSQPRAKPRGYGFDRSNGFHRSFLGR